MSTLPAPTHAESVAIARPAGTLIRRLVLCVALTVLNTIVLVKFAGVLYLATTHHPIEQAGVTLLFAALLGSLARTWFLTLFNWPR